ncbi:MAG: glucose-6-phosphate isomerase, partial [Halobacteria archaeon]|nr:glucose-6-phosphate isomerase [Halobacteria archaeon]
GYVYGVNPFNQPGVESTKNASYSLLGREGYGSHGDRVKELKERLFEI